MSQFEAAPAARPDLTARPGDLVRRLRDHLSALRPDLKDKHFWITQALVVFVAAAHGVIEARSLLADDTMLYFVPISFFLIPTMYAAVKFGISGAIVTALWTTVIASPAIIAYHAGVQQWGELFQIIILNGLSVFVGHRVDRERNARKEAESAESSLRLSEKKYRGLFETAPAPILVLTSAGVVVEGNRAAGAFFGRDPANFYGARLADLIGTESAKLILSGDRKAGPEPLNTKTMLGDRKIYLRSIITRIDDGESGAAFRLIFRDVTEEHGREIGLKAYAASVIHAQEEERKRIARELHDDIIQSLVLLHRRLDKAQHSLQSGSINGDLQEAGRNVEDTVRRLREFATALRPPALDDLGLVASIRRLLADFAGRSTVDAQMKIVGEQQRLPSNLELGLFRIVQEALRNVEKHARATRVTVTITFASDTVTAQVVDNGVGFVTSSPADESCATPPLGILGMKERAEIRGGTLEVHSVPGTGTAVAVSIPLPLAVSQTPGPGTLQPLNPTCGDQSLFPGGPKLLDSSSPRW